MSLKDWVQDGWLSEHQSSREEIKNLLGLVHRDLRECQAEGLSADWSFAIAYNAALQAATASLAAAGYRASRDSHHYRVFQSLGVEVQRMSISSLFSDRQYVMACALLQQ
jgi:hypothetical protein